MIEQLLLCKQCFYPNPIVWPDTGEIVWFKQEKDGTQLYKDGKEFLKKTYGNTLTIGDIKVQGIPFRCCRGHLNFIVDTQEQLDYQEQMKCWDGEPCPYHYRNVGTDPDKMVKCDQRHPCDVCIAYQDHTKKMVMTGG